MDDDLFRRLCVARRMLAGDDDATVDVIARRAGLSKRHLRRAFKALFGQAPHAYRIRARMDRARHALAQEAASVTRAALDQGYASLACFSDTFHRVTGETPSTFRRRAHAGAHDGLPGPFPGCLSLQTCLR
jgi:AraC family transcriptional regulator